LLSKTFSPCALPDDAQALRADIRQFLNESLANYTPSERAYSWMGFSTDFTKKLGEKGWIGMTWPKQYGGQEKSAFCRYVLVEELLASGAPVLAHWTADRQSGPLILKYGTEEQKQKYLPAICKGELYFCIGMSEPDSGSDLSATRTKAEKVDGGWKINGTKLWTTNAHRCHYMIALVRTQAGSERQAGLSQIIIDLKAPGVSIRPIQDLAGESHFNEVVFNNVFAADNQLIGEDGNGWPQVMSELAFERSGPERYLSSIAIFSEILKMPEARENPTIKVEIGKVMAQLITLRQMSLSIAGQLENNQDPQLEASCLKDLGTDFEQLLPELFHSMLETQPSMDSSSEFEKVLAYVTQVSPSFSLRGGTREILRGIIARGLGLR
jgi:alkylation response protein AidB-like acyl-CoA dehydrogenase